MFESQSGQGQYQVLVQAREECCRNSADLRNVYGDDALGFLYHAIGYNYVMLTNKMHFIN